MAPEKSAGSSVARTASISRSRAAASPVMGPMGVTTEAICATSILSAPPSPRAIRRASSLATASRFGGTSVACIEALASSRTTRVRPGIKLFANARVAESKHEQRQDQKAEGAWIQGA